MATTKVSQKVAEEQEAIDHLRGILKPGDRVYTILRHVSKSGMQRSISLAITSREPDSDRICNITSTAARAMGDLMDRKNQGIKVSGCGTDIGFHLVYNLGRVLFPDGFIPAESGWEFGRNGTSATERDKDDGYALRHEWL